MSSIDRQTVVKLAEHIAAQGTSVYGAKSIVARGSTAEPATVDTTKLSGAQAMRQAVVKRYCERRNLPPGTFSI